MFDLPSRTALARLAGALDAVVPCVAFGFAHRLPGQRVSVLCSSRHGLWVHHVDEGDLLELLRPSNEETQQAEIDASEAMARAVEWPLRSLGARRLWATRIPAFEPSTRFWVGLGTSEPLAGEQLQPLEALAQSSVEVLTAPISLQNEERLRRLELAAELLPALLHVLDVREVFDRLSAIANRALPHDVLLMRRFNDDLSTVDVFASSDRVAELGGSAPTGYPPAVIRTWQYSIIDDLMAGPADADAPLAPAGARSTLRLPITFDNRVIGGLAFFSFEPAKYTTADVIVGRRLAEQVASALSYHTLAQRLAEQARRHEELKARTMSFDLLDELLDAHIDSGDLADVFGRISSTTRKVLAHDAALLMVRLADGLHARTYASSGFAPSLPPVTQIPREIVENPNWEHHLFNDLTQAGPTRYVTLVERGFHALLRVPIRLDGQFAGALVLLSKSPSSFAEHDVPIARRVADRLAVTLARDRELDASRRADEATERAARLEARVRALTDELDSRTGYRRVVGESVLWRQVLTQAAQVAATDTTVLLLGESGTGKEVVARFLHRGSSRKNGPFVALNCAALPEQLLEAELFGYERGAFTGATQSKPGQLEQAAGGTLFLDEVGEMSPSAQAKFLRVLQEREFQRLGGTRVVRTDARVAAATNRNLERAIANGLFREDLYYRLNVFAIRLPPLRDRRDDILPLSEAFVGEIGRNLGRPPAGISRDARQMLIEYRWPGNVRELRNILERAAILCDGGLIAAEHLALDVSAPPKPSPAAEPAAAAPRAAVAADKPGTEPASPPQPASAADLQSMERTMIEQALQSARFNKSKAAKALGLSRRQLYIRMRRYGFD